MNRSLPAKLAMLCALLLTVNFSFSQDFTWIKGSSLINQMGVYGTQGVASPNNEPGARANAACWKDVAGNFWLFGGYGFDHIGNNGYLSDLWKYSPTTNQWTYMKGSDIIAQSPVYSPIGVSTPT